MNRTPVYLRRFIICIVFCLATISMAKSQDRVTIKCVSAYESGRELNENDILNATVLMKKGNQPWIEDGPVIDGKFSIDKNCNGQKYKVKVSTGDYGGGVEKFCEELVIYKSYTMFSTQFLVSIEEKFDNLRNLNPNNVLAKNAALAFVANTYAFLNRDNEDLYNEVVSQLYLSLGELYNVEEPIYFDSKQGENGLVVASTELEDSIKLFQQSAGLDVTGKLDYKTISNLTGMIHMDLLLRDTDEYYNVAIQAVEFNQHQFQNQ